jgi:hypothetical protein
VEQLIAAIDRRNVECQQQEQVAEVKRKVESEKKGRAKKGKRS